MKLSLRHCITLCLFALASVPSCAQHHTGAPATAPPPQPPPIVAVSAGLGAIQFESVNFLVPDPQLLAAQVRSADERTRMAALSALGVPEQYLQRGRVALPRSIQTSYEQLDTTSDLDAILTLELDHHIITSILVPNRNLWKRIATLRVDTPFGDTRNTASTFFQIDRSLLDHDHYTAVFHATVPGSRGNFTANEARIMVQHRRALVAISFVSAERDCTAPHAAAPHTAVHPAPNKTTEPAECTILRRWLQPDIAVPGQLTLVSATGRLPYREATGVLGTDPVFDASHLRSFSCQTFTTSSQNHQFEPTTNSTPCASK